MALFGLRDYASEKGLKVDWNQEAGVTINNQPLNTGGLLNYGDSPQNGLQPNTYYGTQAQMDQLLAPYLTEQPGANAGTSSATGMVGLREFAERKGLNVSFDEHRGVMINGTPIDTNGLMNYGSAPPPGYQGDTFYGTSDQINQILSPFSAPLGAGEVPRMSDDVNVQNALNEYKAWAAQQYDQYRLQDLEAKVTEVLSRNFEYDPANDAQFQLAAKELTRNVMETMNSRGILNSSITTDNVTQGVANMMPAYEDQARKRFQDEGQLLMSQIDMLLGIDESNYRKFQDQGDKAMRALEVAMNMSNAEFERWNEARKIRYTEAKDAQEKALQEIRTKREAVADAWDRVNNLGYADNEAAILLGVEPGTLSKSAREAKIRREEELQSAYISYQNQLGVIQAQYAKEEQIARLKADLSPEPSDSEVTASKDLSSNGKILLSELQKGAAGLIGKKEEAEFKENVSGRVNMALDAGIIGYEDAIFIGVAMGLPIEIEVEPPTYSNKSSYSGTSPDRE